MENNLSNTQTIGVKIGSTYSVLAVRGGLETPVTSVIKSCVSTVTDPDTKNVSSVDIGIERPDSIFPLSKGIIENDKLIAPTIAIIKKLNAPPLTRVVAAIPALELIEGRDRLKKALRDSLTPLKMVLSPEVYCGAVNLLGYIDVNGARKLKALHSDFIALNLGSTTLEVLIALHGKRVYLNAFTGVCGSMVDYQILDTVQNKFGKVLTTMPEIRDIKEKFNMNDPKEIQFNVMTQNDGVVQVSGTSTILAVLDRYVFDVCTQLVTILKNTLSPEVIAQVLDTPIVLTGGMGNIPGLSERIEQKMRDFLHYDKITVLKQTDGHIAPAIGALTLANEINWDKIPYI